MLPTMVCDQALHAGSVALSKHATYYGLWSGSPCYGVWHSPDMLPTMVCDQALHAMECGTLQTCYLLWSVIRLSVLWSVALSKHATYYGLWSGSLQTCAMECGTLQTCYLLWSVIRLSVLWVCDQCGTLQTCYLLWSVIRLSMLWSVALSKHATYYGLWSGSPCYGVWHSPNMLPTMVCDQALHAMECGTLQTCYLLWSAIRLSMLWSVALSKHATYYGLWSGSPCYGVWHSPNMLPTMVCDQALHAMECGTLQTCYLLWSVIRLSMLWSVALSKHATYYGLWSGSPCYGVWHSPNMLPTMVCDQALHAMECGTLQTCYLLWSVIRLSMLWSVALSKHATYYGLWSGSPCYGVWHSPNMLPTMVCDQALHAMECGTLQTCYLLWSVIRLSMLWSVALSKHATYYGLWSGSLCYGVWHSPNMLPTMVCDQALRAMECGTLQTCYLLWSVIRLSMLWSVAMECGTLQTCYLLWSVIRLSVLWSVALSKHATYYGLWSGSPCYGVWHSPNMLPTMVCDQALCAMECGTLQTCYLLWSVIRLSVLWSVALSKHATYYGLRSDSPCYGVWHSPNMLPTMVCDQALHAMECGTLQTCYLLWSVIRLSMLWSVALSKHATYYGLWSGSPCYGVWHSPNMLPTMVCDQALHAMECGTLQTCYLLWSVIRLSVLWSVALSKHATYYGLWSGSPCYGVWHSPNMLPTMVCDQALCAMECGTLQTCYLLWSVIRLSVLWSVALSRHATYYGLWSGSPCYGVWHSPNMLPTMVCDQALRAMECGSLQTCYLLWSVIRLSMLWSVALSKHSKHATYYGLWSGSLCYGVWHSPNMLPTMVCDQALHAMECGWLSKHATYYGLWSGSPCYGVWHSPNMLPTMVYDQALCAMECGTLQTCYLLWSVIRLSVLWSVALSKHATYYGLWSGSPCYGVWHSPNMLPTMVCDQALCAMECGTLQTCYLLWSVIRLSVLWSVALSKHATYYGLWSGSLCYGVWHSPNMLPTMVCDQALCAMECGTLQTCYLLWSVIRLSMLWSVALSKHATYYGLWSGSLCYGVWHSPNMLPTMVCDQALCAMECGTLQTCYLLWSAIRLSVLWSVADSPNMLPTMVCDQALHAMECGTLQTCYLLWSAIRLSVLWSVALSKHATYYGLWSGSLCYGVWHSPNMLPTMVCDQALRAMECGTLQTCYLLWSAIRLSVL